MRRKTCQANMICVMGLAFGILVGGGGMALADCPKTPPVPPASYEKPPRAIIKTKFGEIEIVLFPDIAPKHVASFIALAKCGFYNGTIFHRVIPRFMIQGGDPLTKDPAMRHRYGTGGPGYTLPAEFSNIRHTRGIVSAARTADPNSAGSQFFIMVDQAPHLDGQYTVFGEVVRGMEVVDRIVNQPRDARDSPLERIEMTVEIVE